MCPIACDLTKLDDDARARAIDLLARFRGIFTSPAPAANGWIVRLPADAATLSELGELLALERLCCPFLSFHLSVDSDQQARLLIAGPEEARELIATTFLPEAL